MANTKRKISSACESPPSIVSVAGSTVGTASLFAERFAVSSTHGTPMIEAGVLFWITPTLRPTSAG